MPSIYSDQLKQAIIYIRAGETEIAKEIILEIIQNDPDYEKAWIWLVETVPDHAGKIDILKTRLEEYPDNSPLTNRALQRLAPEVLEAQQQSPAVPPISAPPVESAFEEAFEEPASIEFEDDSDDIIRDRLGLDESDEAELFDTSPAFEEATSEDVEFSGADNFEDLFEDAPQTDEGLVFESVDFEDINFETPSPEEPDILESSAEKPKTDEESFTSEDDFENLFEDIEEQAPISTEELGQNLMMEPEDEEELFEKNLEDFLQNNESETLFIEEESSKAQPAEAPSEKEDVDLTDFDSWLSGEEESEEPTAEEDDELSAFLANGFELDGPEEIGTSTSQSNPFVLSEKESLNLFGEDVAEAEEKIPQPKPSSQSQSVFSEEGLKELGIDDTEMEVQFDLDEGAVFPILDDDEVAEPVSADDLVGLGNDLRAEVMGNEVAQSPSKKLEKTKTNKKEKKKNNDKQTFLFGCSVIAAILILTMIGIGYFVWQNWQSSPPDPEDTPITLPTATPTEEYITDAPWLEEDPTEVPSDNDQ